MAKKKRVRRRKRWRCPLGIHHDLLAFPSEVKAEPKYLLCPGCSKERMVPVLRVPPSAKPPRVPRPPAGDKHRWGGFDFKRELDRLLALDGLPENLRSIPIRLRIRRCARKPVSNLGRAGLWRMPRTSTIEARISVSVWEYSDFVKILAALVHELAHVAQFCRTGEKPRHDDAFRRELAHLYRAGYGIELSEANLEKARQGSFMTAEVANRVHKDQEFKFTPEEHADFMAKYRKADNQ